MQQVRSTAFDAGLVVAVLVLHAMFILWVVFGAFLAHSRRFLRALHIASLTWGLLTECLPWQCPLTLLEDWLEHRAGTTPEQGGFLLHYMDKIVYPDLAPTLLMIGAAITVAVNFVYYGWQIWSGRSPRTQNAWPCRRG